MKNKTWFFCCISLFFILFPLRSKASLLPPGSETPIESVKIEITGGINPTKISEVTFDKTRVISGNTEKDSIVEFKVFFRNDFGNLEEQKNLYQKIEVGASGIFSHTLKLSAENTNIIEITASQINKQSTSIHYMIKRKNQESKKRMENQEIVLPGEKKS